MEDLKKKIEAVLFSLGKFVSTEEIANLCSEEQTKVKDTLLELTTDYEDKNSSLVVINDGDMWKLTTREEYGNLVRKIVSETELTKSQMETLAVIAFKYPIKQSDLIKIRTNKAYDHLMELEKAGFITRQRYGRSKLIKLTDKFFEYFDLPREKLKERFLGFQQLASKIESKENEKERLKEEQKIAAEQEKIEAEKEQNLMDGKLDLDDEQDQVEQEIMESMGEQSEEPIDLPEELTQAYATKDESGVNKEEDTNEFTENGKNNSISEQTQEKNKDENQIDEDENTKTKMP